MTDHIENFLAAVDLLKQEYEGITYKLFFHDRPGELRCLRGWVVFNDVPQFKAPLRVDIGPCIYLEWTDPIKTGLDELIDRLRGISTPHKPSEKMCCWSLPTFRTSTEIDKRDYTDAIPTVWKFNHSTQYWEGSESRPYTARRLYALFEYQPNQVLTDVERTKLTTALAKSVQSQEVHHFLQRYVEKAAFEWGSPGMIEIFAPIRVRTIDSKLSDNKLIGTLETGMRSSLGDITVSWQSFRDESNSSLNFHKGLVHLDRSVPQISGRTRRFPLQATITREQTTRLLVAYGEHLTISEYVHAVVDGPRFVPAKPQVANDQLGLENIVGHAVRVVTAPKVSTAKPGRKQATMFVGHSFSPDDLKLAELVKAALRRWGVNVVTGERSEARRISEKVKDRIKTSDAFIAIFTRRHPIAKTGKWTTSPWVVDEKGFALGHDRPVIVLLEDQVSWLDETGGLQGDIEYLPFTRKDVSKALRKLKEIVKDLHLPLRPPKKASQPSAEKLPRDWSKKKGAKLFNGASTASWNSDEEGYWGVRNKMLVGSNEGKWSRLHTKRFWAGSVALRVRFRLLKGDAFQLRLNASDDDAANEAILTTWGVFLANGSGSGDSLAAAKTIKLRHGRWMEAVFVNDNGNGMLFLDGRLALEVLGKFTMNKGPIGLGVEKGDVEVRSIELFRP